MKKNNLKQFAEPINKPKFFVLMIFILILTVITFSLKHLNNRIENKIIQKNEARARTIAKEVEHFLSKPLKLLSQIDYDIQNRKLLSNESIDTYIANCMNQFDLLNMIKILDKNGIVTHTTPFFKQMIGSDLSLDKIIQKAMKSEVISWSPPFISSQTGLISSNLNFPIDNGVITCSIDLSSLNELIDIFAIGRSGYALLIDDTGTLIAHPAGKPSFWKSIAIFIFRVQQAFEEEKGTVRHKIRGIKIFFSIDMVSPVGWRVIVTQPMDNVFVIISEILIMIFACIIIGMLIFILCRFQKMKKTISHLTFVCN